MDTKVRKNVFLIQVVVVGVTALIFTGCRANPQFDPQPQHLQFNESTPNGTTLFVLRASDTTNVQNEMMFNTDSAETNEYVNISQTNTRSPATANIILKKNLDRESHESGITLKFSLTDTKGNTITKTIQLYILDVCDERPKFNTLSYTLEINETDATTPTLVFTKIHATDNDNGNYAVITYTMKSEEWEKMYSEMFTIDPGNGSVFLMRNLDYEKNSFYQFTVSAHDTCNLTADEADFIIKVKDVQDTPPFFTGLPYMASIEERNYKNEPLLQVTALDGDRGIPNSMSYQLRSGCHMNESCNICDRLFNISDSGYIYITGNIDWDMQDVKNIFGICTVTVEATEVVKDHTIQRGNISSSATVTITILDQNNHYPMFVKTAYTVAVQENASPNTALLLCEGTPGIKVFDEDQQGWIIEKDNNTQGNKSSNTWALLRCGDEPGIKVFDKDKQGINSTFTVTLQCENQTSCSTFGVVPSTEIVQEGVIIIRVNNKSLLDYEQIHNMTLTIVAMETGDQNHTNTSTVTVLIGNENDFPPEFDNKSYEAWIPEGLSRGKSVINITATDHDQGKYGEIRYSLAGGNNLFSVNNGTGQIITNCEPRELDFEMLQQFYLSLTATDGGGRFNQTQLTVHLRDENDNSPVFQQEGYTAFLEENTTVYLNTSFLIVKATDRDQNGTKNSAVSYMIQNITDLAHDFTINNETGEIMLVSPLDFEALNDPLDPRIHMTVIAYDHGQTQRSTTAMVNITVVDINDNAPHFTQNQYNGIIPENATHDHYVETVNATDADKTLRNNQIYFAIAEGGFDKFRINSSSGVVSVQTGARFDRDEIGLYNLTIIAIDQGENSHTSATTLRVTITDVNNKPPYFKNNTYSSKILEDLDPISTVPVITCDAMDPDEKFSLNYKIIHINGWDENRQKVNSSLIQMIFRINEHGSVYVNSSLDREVVETFELTLWVSDTEADIKYGVQTATATLTVTVLDVNDNDPEFSFEGHLEYYQTNVSENADNPTILMSVLATDKDLNRTIKYSISDYGLNDGINNSTFKIAATTGVLSKTGDVDRERTPTVNLTIIATDNGYPSRHSNATIVITILDFNDNTPQFCLHNSNNTYHVLESANVSAIVAIINATDADTGQNSDLYYTIETENIPFNITKTTGVIFVSDKLDREGGQGPSYRLTILAQDNPIDRKLVRTNRTTITIVLDDVNDNPPRFTSNTSTTKIPRDTATNNTIFIFTVTDVDALENGTVSFAIENNTNAADYFNVISTVQNEGKVLISRNLIDRVGWHNLTLTATDHGNPKLSSTMALYIDVLDVNLNSPEIRQSPGQIKAYECASMDTVIANITATDKDKSSPNNEFIFSMFIIQPQNNTNFKIDKDTGQVKVNANLSAANTSIYEVQIMATDKGTPNRTSSPLIITIIVEDVNDQPPRFTEKNFNFSVQEGQNNIIIGQVVAIDHDRNSFSCFSFKDIGIYDNYFTIDEKGFIMVKKPLDRENKNQSTITFSVEVKDCSEVVDVSNQCGNYQSKWNSTDRANVRINVVDADDNPPQFVSDVLRIGMRRNTEPNKEILQLKAKVTDKDLPENGINKWVFEMVSFNMTGDLNKLSGNQKSEKGCTSMICVTGNGTVVNMMWYTQDISGIFNLNVLVRDGAGNSTAYIQIFLIADSQVLKMTLLGDRTTVALTKDTILSACSNVTGKLFVYDNIEDHITDGGTVETTKTDLFFHIAEYENNRVLSADEAKRFLDAHADELYNVRFKNSIISIESSLKSELPGNESTKTTYVMAAVIGLLALVIVIVGYMFFSSSNRYKRKLRAAMPMGLSEDVALNHYRKVWTGPSVAFDLGKKRVLGGTAVNREAADQENLLHRPALRKIETGRTARTAEKEMNTLKDDFAVPGSNMYANRENPLLKAEPAPPGYDEIDATSHNSLDENEVDYTKREIPKDELEEREVTMDMYGEDYNSQTTFDPLEAALREHDAQKQAAMYKQGVSTVQVNHGFVHDLELETTEI